MKFPEKFTWGVATASYQIEGGWNCDGRGPTVWDDYCHYRSERIFDRHTGDAAVDFYHRYAQDLKMMKELGIPALRFSVAWSRVMPEGRGAVNEKGMDFYRNLIDAALENGIEPFMTLFHWDLPAALDDRGAWLNPDISDWFADYAAKVGQALGDRVEHIMTFNEPQCFLGDGYFNDVDAPGIKRSRRDLLRMAHNTLLAHGKAVMAIRSVAPKALIGVAPTSGVALPVTEKDVDAARRAYFELPEDGTPLWTPSWWSDPAILGRYPDDAWKMGADMPAIGQNDLKIICQKLDFYGQNIYNGYPVVKDGDGWKRIPRKPGYPRSACNWPLTPEALYWGPKFLYERYHLPIYITENGISCHDAVLLDGKVHDPNRIDTLERYIHEFGRAILDGVDGRGYFVWTLMDDFEWRTGYSDRFGLVHVDFETQKRLPKDSAYWYGKIARENGAGIYD